MANCETPCTGNVVTMQAMIKRMCLVSESSLVLGLASNAYGSRLCATP